MVGVGLAPSVEGPHRQTTFSLRTSRFSLTSAASASAWVLLGCCLLYRFQTLTITGVNSLK